MAAEVLIAPTAAQPGDVFVYARGGFFNRIISLKTWSRFSHVEVAARDAAGNLKIAGSRNGKGCQIYDYEADGLALVVRPTAPFNQEPAMGWWIDEAVGQGYDWIGLLNFAYAQHIGINNGKMFCSEAATRYLRKGGVDPFPETDADKIPPSYFASSPLLRVVWRSPDEQARYQKAKDEGRWQ